MLGDGLSRSPAVQTSDRKQDEGTIQQRMQHMIDLQAAYNGSFQLEESKKNSTSAEVPTQNSSLLQSKQVDLTTINGSELLNPTGGGDNTRQQNFRSIMPTLRAADTVTDGNENVDKTLPSNLDSTDSLVGKGIILFPETYQPSILSMPKSQYQAVDHEFSYENGIPVDGDSELDQERYKNYMNSIERKRPTSFCCILHPCWDCMKQWFTAENLHRSFCYAAIDGMLTGSGLAGALTGFGLVPKNFLVAVCAVACIADALCMALGHVWSTHVLSNQAATERRRERAAFEANRFETKSRLVDLLLSRGMLKIDATSIADTLEGYPDIFLSALVGEDICSGRTPNSSQNDLVGSTSPLNQKRGDGYYSYGQFNELQHDPDLANVLKAVGESRKEGFVMFISFSIFGTIPSIILRLLSLTVHNGGEASGGDAISNSEEAIYMSLRSAALSILCVISWILGVWKSHFFEPDSWILFGFESVVVMLVCIFTAFFLGTVLSTVVQM